MQYSFGRSEHRVEAPGFAPGFHDASVDGLAIAHLIKHFPWVFTLIDSMPKKWATAMSPNIASVFSFKEVSCAVSKLGTHLFTY
jgi:hypothetical protein